MGVFNEAWRGQTILNDGTADHFVKGRGRVGRAGNTAAEKAETRVTARQARTAARKVQASGVVRDNAGDVELLGTHQDRGRPEGCGQFGSVCSTETHAFTPERVCGCLWLICMNQVLRVFCESHGDFYAGVQRI